MEHFGYTRSLVVITDQDIINTLIVQGNQLPEYNIGSLGSFGHPNPEDGVRLFELRVTPCGQAIIAFVGDRASEHYGTVGNEILDHKHMPIKIVGGFTVGTSVLQNACYLQLQRRGEFTQVAAQDKMAAS